MYANIKYGYHMLENNTLPQWLPSVVIHKRDKYHEVSVTTESSG